MTEKKVEIEFKDNIIKAPPMEFEEEPGGIGYIMFPKMKANQDKIAQIDCSTGEQETFGSLLKRSVRTALHLLAKGVTRDDIVCLCSDNNMDGAIPYVASLLIGVKIACLDPTQSRQELTHLLNLVKPKLLFTIPKSVSILEKIIKEHSIDTEIVVFGDTTEHTKFAEFVTPHPGEDQFEPVFIQDSKETALIKFSSGTSGLPKGICLHHHAIQCQMYLSSYVDNPDLDMMKSEASRISSPISIMTYASLYWISAGLLLISTMMSGCCRLLCSDFDPVGVWYLIHKYKPFMVCLVPVNAIAMCRNGRPKDVDTSCIIRYLVIGSPIPKDQMVKIRQALPETEVYQGYGQTEVTSMIVSYKANDTHHQPHIKNKPDSVGLPCRGFTYKVVDLDTDEAVGPYHKGELRLKSDMLMNGYYNKDSSECYDKDGWFRTGDVVYYDEDFCFYVVDRIRELFKYKGWHVTPAILEGELLLHPAVKEAVVIGIPHEEDGDHPIGIVTLQSGFDDIKEEDIAAFVNDKVQERQKLRAGVRIVKTMPMTPTGKVNRRVIKSEVLSGSLK